MGLRTTLGLASLSAALSAPLGAATFDDPDWPCIQRKVEALSVGLMWTAPITDVPLDPETRHLVDDLVDRLILRRIDVEETRPLIDAFARQTSADMDLMGQVFEAVFDRLAADRRNIMAGIADYSQTQIALTRRIEGARDEMIAIMAGDTPDFDQVDALEEQIDWDERIYTDRQRSLTYICETPVLLERRLYAIAQMLQQAASN